MTDGQLSSLFQITMGIPMRYIQTILILLLVMGCENGMDRLYTFTPNKIIYVPVNDKRINAKRVLVVHSYHKEYEWVAGVSRGIQYGLENTSTDIKFIYLNTKIKNYESWKIQAGSSALRTIDQWNPDIIITVDDNAQLYVARHLIHRKKPQIAFCGVNGAISQYGFPAPNVTGILERPHFIESIELAEQICGNLNQIAVISDNSTTSKGALEFIARHHGNVTITAMNTPATLSEWKRAILDVQSSSQAIAIYTYHTIRTGTSRESIEARSIMEWTVSNSKIPVIGFFTFAVDDGALCGIVESGFEQGYEAGKIARELLTGRRASEIPVRAAVSAQSMINLQTAQKLSIYIPENRVKSFDIVIGG